MTAKTIPPGKIGQHLRESLKAGRTAEQAAGAVLGPYREVLAAAGNDSLVGYARPAVLSEARRLARQMMRASEDRAFSSPEGSRERLSLGDVVFAMPDGTRVSWAQATLAQHAMRTAWLRTYITSVEEDLERHERAEEIIRKHAAEQGIGDEDAIGQLRLSDVPGWEDLIGDPDDDGDDGEAASGVVEG